MSDPQPCFVGFFNKFSMKLLPLTPAHLIKCLYIYKLENRKEVMKRAFCRLFCCYFGKDATVLFMIIPTSVYPLNQKYLF